MPDPARAVGPGAPQVIAGGQVDAALGGQGQQGGDRRGPSRSRR
ncbi:hypothetical protein ACSNOJ_22225 [Streptomyces sp. URMC 128]